jgi:hypothetical protein
MPIYYKVAECTNPAGAIGVDYATNRETRSSMMGLEQLAKNISHATSITETDVKGII